MTTDSLADCLTRIRNAQIGGHKSVRVHAFRLNKAVLDVLKREGFIDSYSLRKADKSAGKKGTGFDQLEVVLKYFASGEPVLRELTRISKSGRRVYSHIKDLPKVGQGLGITVLSTPAGVMSDREARGRGVGGELLVRVSS
ncbi:MAG: 30S ribosomal protein S8 [Bdellovibrionota bacterium]|nr:MAG: 30S ribosomal protein S8 [Bdellovibrionota bacterium]